MEIYNSIATGELQGSASALQLPDINCRMVMFKALGSNAGDVYLGISGVTVVNGTTDTTSGWELAAGEQTQWIPVTNLNILYRICDNTGDDLVYMAIG